MWLLVLTVGYSCFALTKNCFHIGLNRYGNKILVTDELPDGQMVDQWEPVTHDSVKTPLEVYFCVILILLDTDMIKNNYIKCFSM